MPRSRAGTGGHDLRFDSQGSLRSIEAINEQLIESEVRNHRKAIVRRERDSVGVRSFLPLRIYAGALVLHEPGSPPQPTVFQDRKRSYAAPRVIGDQRVSVGTIKSDVSRVFTARGNLVQEREFPRLGIDGECTHCARGLAVIVGGLVDRIEESIAGIDAEKRRLGGFGGKTQRGQLAGCGVQTERINSFAAMVGIGANVNQIFLFGGSSSGLEHRW